MIAPSLADLRDEARSLTLPSFDHDFAWALGASIREIAKTRQAPVAIEVRHSNDVVFATLLPGATIDNFDWTRRKCNAVHRFHRASLALRLEAEEKGYDFNTRFRLPPADYAASGGGVPLMLSNGILIGSVGVSGLPDIEDHAFIVARLKALI